MQIAYKSTNHFMYIHETSYHPHSSYKSVANREALRILGNCFDKAHFKLHHANLVQHLQARELPWTAISLAKSVVYTKRDAHLHGKTKSKDAKTQALLDVYACTVPPVSAVCHHQELAGNRQ